MPATAPEASTDDARIAVLRQIAAEWSFLFRHPVTPTEVALCVAVADSHFAAAKNSPTEPHPCP